MKPLAIDLFCGLGGWTEGLLAEGYRVVGFDVERHVYGDAKYPAQLVLQDVLTIHGSQFKTADLIVASPPCQEYSYMAMPWSIAKQKAREYRDGTRNTADLTALFDACFRIQREAIAAAGHHIPLVVENVRGAQEWVGRSRFHFGSFHLWGDVPALMPMTRMKAIKVPSFRFDGSGRSFQTASVEGLKMPTGDAVRTDKGRSAALAHYDQLREEIKNGGASWFNVGSRGQKVTGNNPVHALTAEGFKQGGDWFNKASGNSISRRCSSRSKARKHASAMIAKIPVVLARFIAHTYHPNQGVKDEGNDRQSGAEIRPMDSRSRTSTAEGAPCI